MSATTQDQIEAMMLKAESGEDWAEIARLEAEMLGGPFYPVEAQSLAPSVVDISTVSEYGLTQKLSNSIRCF